MCTDENGAPHAAHYLNGQLALLYHNAKKCVEEHGQAHTEENKKFHALAEFTVHKPGTSDIAFHASFDKPELTFVCNHDALLHLTLCCSKIRCGQELIELPPKLQLTYRVGFETDSTEITHPTIGAYTSTIELVILDLKKARLVSALCEGKSYSEHRDLLLQYMAGYLEFLCNAGNHVLFSLPQFDQDGLSMHVDYSVLHGNLEEICVGDVFGVTVKQINEHMSSSWLKSAMLATGITGENADWHSRSLFEISTNDVGGGEYGHFKAKLGPPRVDILCTREVVVRFSITELVCFETRDFTAGPIQKLENKHIAFIIDVTHSRTSEEHVADITFDLTEARYDQSASSTPSSPEEAEIWYQVISFFSTAYMEVIQEARYDIIYSHHAQWEAISRYTSTTQEDVDGTWWTLGMPDAKGTSSRETVQRTKMHDFDQVLAISQGSINAQFSALAVSAKDIFARWKYGDCFEATFEPMSLHLLSNNRAIVWVHLSGGEMKTSPDGSALPGNTPYKLKGCHLAFEVELKMCTQVELEAASSEEACRKGLAYERHGKATDRVLKHIYLDFLNAEYLHDYSATKALHTGDPCSSIDALRAVICYLKQHYFHDIHQAAQHVVSSFPVWCCDSSPPSYALTSIMFHVYSNVEVNRHNWMHVREPVLVVLGMTRFRPLPPTDYLHFSTDWVVRGERGFSHGTLALARRAFIDERLVLDILSRVNADTTLVVKNSNAIFQGHESEIKLLSWGQHEKYKTLATSGELQPEDGTGYRKYLWKHRDQWTHNFSGNSTIMSASHDISCTTENYVEFPTTVDNGELRINLRGKVDLKWSLKTTQCYAASSSVSWSTTITMSNQGSGIKVTTESIGPVVTDSVFSEGAAQQLGTNPKAVLLAAFPKKVDLHGLVEELSAFEGAWQYCCTPAHTYSLASPMFNDDGDLLFELRRYVPGMKTRPPNSPQIGARGSNTKGRYGRSSNPGSPGARSPARPSTPSNQHAGLRVQTASSAMYSSSRSEYRMSGIVGQASGLLSPYNSGVRLTGRSESGDGRY